MKNIITLHGYYIHFTLLKQEKKAGKSEKNQESMGI